MTYLKKILIVGNMTSADVYKNPAIAENYDAILAKRKSLCFFDTEYLRKNIKSGDRVLDLGCGTGRHLLGLCDLAEMTGIDISPKMIEIADRKLKGKAKLIVGDIINVNSLVDGKFNVVLMMYHTLGSIDSSVSRADLFCQINKLLKENGRLILHVHNRRHIKNLRFLLQRTKGDKIIKEGLLKGAIIHFFTKKEVEELANEHGFKMEEVICLKYPEEAEEIRGWKKYFCTGGYIFNLRKK